MILDTSFIIDVMKNDTKAVEKLHYLIDNNKAQILPAPVIFELCAGIAQSSQKNKEHEKIQAAINQMLCIQLDPTMAAKAGMIQGELIRKGKTIGRNRGNQVWLSLFLYTGGGNAYPAKLA